MEKYRNLICAAVELLIIVIIGCVILHKPKTEEKIVEVVKKVEIDCVQPVAPVMEEPEEDIKEEKIEIQQESAKPDKSDEVLEDFIMDSITASITHYGPDCKGCSGVTASGYNVKNTIYYDDVEYGQVRIVAMDKSIPLYSIIRINDYKDGNFLAIVLDRGGAIKGNKIDILVNSEQEATKLGVQKKASVDILRRGKYAN